jgi:hypothetical protein
MMSAITVARGNSTARFFSVTFVSSQPGDFEQHQLRIQVTDRNLRLIAQANDWPFQFGYLLDPSGPGGFTLTTEFNIDVTPYQLPLHCLVSAFVDGQTVARAPIMLRRLV